MGAVTSAILALSVLISQAEPGKALPAPEIQEWKVPWENTRPRDPIVANDGRVWFVGQVGNYLGVLTPASGAFARHELPKNTLPHNVILGPKGDLWVAGNGNGTILRVSPKTGKVAKTYAMPARVKDPHTLIFSPEGKLWFTAQHSNVIGRLDPANGKVDLVEPSVKQSRPYGIIAGNDGNMWVVLFGTNRLAAVDTKTLAINEYPLPSDKARPRRLAQINDGSVWYVDYAEGSLGRLDPKTGKVTVRAVPGGEKARPYAMAADAKDRLWFAESGSEPNRIVGFDPKADAFSAPATVPSGGGTVRHMVYDKASNTLWFGADTNTIGKATLP